MWTCPNCGRSFTNPRQAHSCVLASVGDFLKGKPAEQVALYRRFEEAALSVGSVNLAPAKRRIGFQHGRIFAAANGLSRNGLRVHIVTSKPIRSRRVVRTDAVAPDCHVNHFLIRSESDVDEAMSRWLREGYRWG